MVEAVEWRLMAYGALREHREYLSDQVRSRAYETALAAVCRDAVVLDLGCGTGIWGLVALRHGARRVYAVDGTGMLDWAKAVARRNGAGDRIVHVRGWSKDVELPERVDVVVCDQFGPFLLEGDPVGVLADAARRHLRPGGTMIPERIHYWGALSRSTVVQEALDFWSGAPLGFDFDPLHEMAAATRWYERLDETTFAAGPFRLGTIVPAACEGSLVRLAADHDLAGAGRANALACWFQVELAPGLTVSNGPCTGPRLDRDAVVLPLAPELAWDAGARAEVAVTGRIASDVLAWSVSIGSERRRSSTVGGSLAGAADIRAAAVRVTTPATTTAPSPRSGERRSPTR
jgi:protein arginine N-methyltransferase 1